MKVQTSIMKVLLFLILVKQLNSQSSLGVKIDENVTWKQAITLMQDKISKKSWCVN